MSDDFYRAFEERYRGSREVIKSRQRVYLPFIEPLRSIYDDAKAIDLGCGRGEWLELLKESGFDAQGIDLDDGMLAACRDLGLNVATADAVATLKALPDASQSVVSGFHIAEHIQFSDLQTLVQEALRVLKPAGLLILETPNPENIVVGSCTFYLDPTHQRPIPPLLLAFLPEHYGFSRTKILRLQEAVGLSEERILSLKDVLGGASPDYAVVAQKTADEIILAATSQAFEPDYGISLEALADRYDSHAKARALQTENIAHAAETKALQAETTAHAAETEALHAETTAHAAEARAFQAETIAHAAEARAFQAETRDLQAQERAAKAEAQAQNLHHSLHAICNSRSWRLTAPLRWSNLQVRLLREQGFLARTKALAKKIARPLMRNGIAFVEARPALRRRCIDLARKFGFYEAIRERYERPTGHSLSFPATSSSTQISAPEVDTDHTQLSPRAQQIYVDLKTAIKKNKEAR